MKKRNIFLIGLIVLIAGGMLYYNERFPSGTWRYRLTVVVETPEGLKTGSAVRQVKVSTSPIDLPEATSSKEVKGEAVVVDLGERGVLFGLISHGSYTQVFEAFPMEGATTPKGIKYYRSLPSGSKASISKEIPRFVRFKDLSDPKSVEAVDRQNFAASFGEGVQLKEVTVEMTNDRVTSGVVDKYLSEDFWKEFQNWWASASANEKMKYAKFFNFKQGK